MGTSKDYFVPEKLFLCSALCKDPAIQKSSNDNNLLLWLGILWKSRNGRDASRGELALLLSVAVSFLWTPYGNMLVLKHIFCVWEVFGHVHPIQFLLYKENRYVAFLLVEKKNWHISPCWGSDYCINYCINYCWMTPKSEHTGPHFSEEKKKSFFVPICINLEQYFVIFLEVQALPCIISLVLGWIQLTSVSLGWKPDIAKYINCLCSNSIWIQVMAFPSLKCMSSM